MPEYLSITVLLLLLSASVVRTDFPSNEYQFSLSRDALMKAEVKFEHRKERLEWEEETVDHYLQYLKWREFMATQRTGFPPSRPLEETLGHIKSSEIYWALWKFPKGGNMHAHENHDLSRKVLLDIVWSSPDFQYVHMLPPDHPTSPWTLDFFVNPPTNEWINLKATNAYTKEEILRHQTFIGTLSYQATRYPTDSSLRWKEMNVLWDRVSNVISNLPIKRKYLEAMYEIGLNEGIIYFETRKNIYEKIYVLDASPQYRSDNGRRYLNPKGDQEVALVLKLSRSFAKKHPEFVGHRRISSVQRRSSREDFDFYMENAIRMHNLYPDHVIGFDVIGEEDVGYASLHFVDAWLKLYNRTTRKLRISLYLHTAETNWPDDLMVSNQADDIVPTLDNSYESILLNATRIGHGYGFIKHPYLMMRLRDRRIAIEVCVVSNQLLGFTPDIRNHPAQHYLRYGIPIVLGTDDAGIFGYDSFTVDWYEVFMAWGLDLQDLRTLAINSLAFSGLNERDKYDAINNKWKPMWKRYVAETYQTACGRDYTGEAWAENRRTAFGALLPRVGSRIVSTTVHIFGVNFESGICKRVKCKFGDRVSPMTYYISNQHVVCKTPDFGDGAVRTVDVSLALDGYNFVNTGFTFKYEYDTTN